MAKLRANTEQQVSSTLSCTRAALLCGRTITVTPRRPGAFQLHRPLGDACGNCDLSVDAWHGSPFRPEYMRESPTGAHVGPICRPWAYKEA